MEPAVTTAMTPNATQTRATRSILTRVDKPDGRIVRVGCARRNDERARRVFDVQSTKQRVQSEGASGFGLRTWHFMRSARTGQ